MEILLTFLKSAYDFLGIRGIIIIALLAFIGVETFIIKENRIKIADLNGAITTMKAAVEIQNAAVDKASKERDALQVKVDGASKDIKKIKSDYDKLKGGIITLPPPKNCPDSISELRSQTTNFTKRWNK